MAHFMNTLRALLAQDLITETTMPTDITIHMLLLHGKTDQKPLSRERWNRVASRVAWVKETVAALRAAQREMDECLTQAVRGTDEHGTGTAAVDRFSEDEARSHAGAHGEHSTEFNLLFEAEQAKVDAIRSELETAIQHDKWPQHLYWGNL